MREFDRFLFPASVSLAKSQDPKHNDYTIATKSATKTTMKESEAAAKEENNERKGHLLFGKICDMRIAVVSFNLVNILLILFGIIATGIKYRAFSASLYAFQNSFLALSLSIVGVLGALNYVLWMVAVATAGFALGFLLEVIGLHWIGILIGGLVLYPHAFLTYEIKEGIMSKETYAREEHIVENDYIKV